LMSQSDIQNCFISENISTVFDKQFTELAARSDILVMLGEAHGVALNFDIYLNVIKSLNQKMNYRYIAFERSHLEVCLFNKFLITGDKDYLRWDVAYSKEMVDFFVRLREYNTGLPVGNQLSFIGVDAIHSIHAFVAGIQSLMPNKPAPDNIKNYIDSIKNLNLPLSIKPQTADEYFRILDDAKSVLRTQLLQDSNAYQGYFGDDFYNLDFALKSKSSYSRPLLRNESMYNNLNYALEQLNNSHSVLGFFGSNHVINLISTRKSFATLISENNKSKFKDVYRILIEYKNSKALFQSRIVDVPSTVIETLRKNEQKQLRHFIDSLMCAGNLLLPAMQISPSLATNFDYLIIVKSGKPVTPIR